VGTELDESPGCGEERDPEHQIDDIHISSERLLATVCTKALTHQLKQHLRNLGVKPDGTKHA